MLLHFVVLFEKKNDFVFEPILFQLERCYGNLCKVTQIRTLFLMCCYITVSVYRSIGLSLVLSLSRSLNLILSLSVLRSFCVSVICAHSIQYCCSLLFIYGKLQKKYHQLWKVAMRTPELEIGKPPETRRSIYKYKYYKHRAACHYRFHSGHFLSACTVDFFFVEQKLQLAYISNLIFIKLIQNFNGKNIIIARFTQIQIYSSSPNVAKKRA